MVGSRCSEEWVKNMCRLIALQLVGHRLSGEKRGRAEGGGGAANLNLKNQEGEKKEEKVAGSLRPEFVNLFGGCRMPVTDWPPYFAGT